MMNIDALHALGNRAGTNILAPGDAFGGGTFSPTKRRLYNLTVKPFVSIPDDFRAQIQRFKPLPSGINPHRVLELKKVANLRLTRLIYTVVPLMATASSGVVRALVSPTTAATFENIQSNALLIASGAYALLSRRKNHKA